MVIYFCCDVTTTLFLIPLKAGKSQKPGPSRPVILKEKNYENSMMDVCCDSLVA